jgi:dTDP-glucose 4,6-dehydratase
METALITGGAGFIGSAVVRALRKAGWAVVVLDKLSYAGDRAHLDGTGAKLIVGDVCDSQVVAEAVRGVDAVVHMAAESHVARSLHSPELFLRTNVLGTRVVLDAAHKAGVPRFVHMSTDEVFGAAPPGVAFDTDAPHRPGNTYAASKSGAEALVHAWRHTHDYPACIVRCTNNFGPRQHTEKAIPNWIEAALKGGPIPVHGAGTARRDWLYVDDMARGIERVLDRWHPDAVWHFAGRQEYSNREMAKQVGALLGVDTLCFGPERQGQDSRYALDDTATRERLGWAPITGVSDGLRATVAWVRQRRQGADSLR